MRRSSDSGIGFYDSSKPENPFVGSADPTQTFTAGPNVGANTVRKIYTKYNGEMVTVKKMYTTSGGHKDNPVLIFESEE